MSEWPGVSEHLPGARLVVLSLGVGFQSGTLLHMAERGDVLPRPDFAIFGDTVAEPSAVYRYLKYLRANTSIPIIEVSKGDLREAVMTKKSTVIPAFVAGADGKAAPLNRNCTRDYKVTPIEREIKRLLGYEPGQRMPTTPIVERWIGISTDELQRMKKSRVPWIVNRFPLVEKRMRREDCPTYCKERQIEPPPWSSCTFCPFHDDATWREVRADPEMWADACAVDVGLRNPLIKRSTDKPMFLHRSLVPLAEAPIDDPDSGQLDLFSGECEGMCGV